VSFVGPPFSESRLIYVASAYETATTARKPPTFLPHAVEGLPD
jgi:Asp-tRNA(Asn)/Glu-tRNA(Gln) amidotransferase A subunit family amidase